MPRQFVVIEGPDKGKIFPLKDGAHLMVGRTKDGTQLTDLTASREHCEVRCDGGRVTVRDNNSSQGTYVNEERVTDTILFSGNILRVGQTQLRFQDDTDVSEMATIAGGIFVPPVPDSPPPSAEPADPMAVLTGKRIGPFEVGPIIAKRRVSVIFKAKDTDEARAVALKVFRPDATKSEGEMQRLNAGLKSVLPVRHPNLVACYGVGKTDGRCWVASEYVEGESLEETLKRVGLAGMLDWQHALRLGLHLARGLEALHKHKIVHGGLVPRNVLIDSGSDKLARISGLARARGPEAGPSPPPEEFLRDASFLSPERAKDLDHGTMSSDVYSLGATLYVMLTGRRPFEAASPLEILRLINQSEVVRPREFQLGIPERFEQVVLKMLARKPEDRYPSAAKVRADLEELVKSPGNPPLAGPSSHGSPREGGSSSGTNAKRLTVTCSGCGQALQFRERFAGTKVRCPTCEEVLLLPGRPVGADGSPGHRQAGGKTGTPAAAGVSWLLVVIVVLGLLLVVAGAGVAVWFVLTSKK